MNERLIDIQNFRLGFQALEDTTKAPVGSLRIMRNTRVTDRGGLAPRPGTVLLGSANASTKVCRGFFNFKKSDGSDEVLVKAYDTELEFLSKNYSSSGWQRLKTGFTSGKEFGFMASLVNTDNQDKLIFCNRFEPYQTWEGTVTLLNGALAGGETTVTVDSTLLPDIYEAQTATASSATTLTVSTAAWGASQWVNFYVHILSGVNAGKISKISANTGTQITFATLGSDPGLCQFEIRQIAFPVSGTLILGGNTLAYSAIPTATTFTTSAAAATANRTPVTVVPIEYPLAPRGNRMANYLTRAIIGNVRSALNRDSGGALQGYSAAGSYFVSKINTPTDFSFSATRVAGEGDVVSAPYGGGDFTDIIAQEDSFYAFKAQYIEKAAYSQDTADLITRTPLKTGIGSVGKAFVGTDDVYFITPDKQITSLGRVQLKDLVPSTVNIGYKIRRYLENIVVDDVGRGAQIGGKLYFPVKSNSAAMYNDVVLVYNKQYSMWEGIWDIGAFSIERFNDQWYYAESDGPDVYEMFVGNADVVGTTRNPIFSEVATHFINLTPTKSAVQGLYCLFVEGYILGGTTITFNMWKDFSDDPFLTFDFSTTEQGLLDGTESKGFLGGAPLGIDPLGATFSDPDADGKRHFSFRVYFPFQYGNFFSIGHRSNDADIDYEITRYSVGVKYDTVIPTSRIKTV